MAEPPPPKIYRIAEPLITPGAEDFLKEKGPLTSGQPGTPLLIVGAGFGKESTDVEVSFGTVPSDAYPFPLFSENRVMTTVPLAPAGPVQVSVSVRGIRSNEINFAIKARQAKPRPEGTVTRRFLTSLEALILIGTEEGRIADFGKSITPALKKRIDEDLPSAVILVLKLKAALARLGPKVLAAIDDQVEDMRLLSMAEDALLLIKKGGETEAGIVLEEWKKIVNGWTEIIEGFGESVGEEGGGGIIKAIAKDLKGFVVTLLEVEVQRKMAHDHEVQEQEKERKEEEFRQRIEGKLDREESKLDREEEKLDIIESKIGFVEVQIDRLESKLDREMQSIDKLESKSDKQEMKLDKTEVKLDHIEEKLDKNELKNDRLESKLDKLGPVIDRQEAKLDKLESKADLAEAKLEHIDVNLHKLEGKADKAENKLDKLEPKIDKLEPKLDKLEPKIDQLDPKIRKLEPKLDRLQVVVDRGKEFWQFDPASWQVRRAKSVGVQVQGPAPPTAPTTWAFSVESIHIPEKGFTLSKIIVDGVTTDISSRSIVTPSNVLVDCGLSLIGASRRVRIEFDRPYTGRVEFNGEKPQGMTLCTVVTGAGSSQRSPNPCRAR